MFMSFFVLLALLIAVAAYWFVTQILPERRHESLLRFGLADGYLTQINERRHADGLPILELDEDLMLVAERKAAHQLMTGDHQEGWEYPRAYSSLFGQSLLMEVLIQGPAAAMGERLARERELFDGEWIQCGIGVSGGQSGQVVVAMVLCREAWQQVPETRARRSLMERLVLGD
jgi:hypothetical protein